MDWMEYHIAEEFLIAAVCLVLGVKSLMTYRKCTGTACGADVAGRIYLMSMGFFLLAVNSALHSLIHEFGLSRNLLFHTLAGYTLGLLLLIFSISFRDPSGKKFLPVVLYTPLLVIFLPWIYHLLPPFTEFRPLLWVLITYLSGALSMLFVALFRNTGLRSYLFISGGFLLSAVSGIFLFFPSSIGSAPWAYGHLLRPLGFLILLFAVDEENLMSLTGSILYRALVAFSLLAAIPLIFFGIAIFYDELTPFGILERRFLIFTLILATLAAALIFGMGTVSRLLRPLLELRKGVDTLAKEGFEKELQIRTGDEIEELSVAFNKVVSELKESVRGQEKLSRLAAMGELSARLAHEIRNPLDAIAGATSYIGRNYKGRLISEFLKIIKEEVDRINIITTSLLNFAKPVSPLPVLSDVNKVVDETVDLIRQEFADNGVLLESELSRDLPLTLLDRNQIKQVLINLLLNALDVSERGQKVRIISEREDGAVVVSVRDFGPGIREEDLGNIFRPFFTTKIKGTGLGLSIAERIAGEHGGEIMVKSSEGDGSMFRLLLPIKR